MSPLGNKYWRKPKYVKLYESRGMLYSYYRRGGLEFAIKGEPGTKEWLEDYEAIHSRFESRQKASGPKPGSLAAAIVAYRESDRFQILAQSTKTRYDYALSNLRDKLGHLPLSSITRRSVVRLQAKIAETKPRNAIEAVKVLRLVYECACDLGEVDFNPAKGVRKPPGYRAQQFDSWSDDQLDLFLNQAKPIWRRAVMVALYTGLRRSDLIRLTRGHIKNGWLIVDIEKTEGQVEIPLHSDLDAELKQKMPAASLMLIPTARGKRMNKDSLSHGVQKECQRLGITPNPPLHGLRRNAIIRLLEAGCSREEVMAITDQSERMVKHYAGRQHKRVLAQNAILKLEEATRNRQQN